MRKRYFSIVFLLISCLALFSYTDQSIENDPKSTDEFIPDIERYALIVLHGETNGDFWNRNKNWKLVNGNFNHPGTEHTWFGVEVRDNHVIGLNLSCNNLNGEIPVEIGYLTYLKKLDLDCNSLTGNIPFEIGNLINMKHLSLSSNKLEGPIPKEITKLKNLEKIYYFNNPLESNDNNDELVSFLNHKSGVLRADNQKNQKDNLFGVDSIEYNHTMNGINVKLLTQDKIISNAKSYFKLNVTTSFSIDWKFVGNYITASIKGRKSNSLIVRDIYKNNSFYQIRQEDINKPLDLIFEDFLTVEGNDADYIEIYPYIMIYTNFLIAT